jgi:hypothetical protein
MLDPISKFVTDYLLGVTSELIMPLMVIGFFVGITARFFLYLIARSEFNFAKEFYMRVYNHFQIVDAPKVASFHRLTRILMVKTFTECFETKMNGKRRNLDYIQSLFERLFLIEDGMKRLIEDTLKQTRYLKKDNNNNEEKLLDVSRHVFENNPFFNRLMGVFNVSLLNDVLNILPSLFIIGGIFGTFLGISKSLPDLGNMDLNNAEETKRIMDLFLLKISQSMIKSIIGIAASVTTSLINTVLSIEGTHYNTVNKFAAALEHVWNETTTNEIDKTEVFPEVDHAKTAATAAVAGTPPSAPPASTTKAA